MDEAVVSWITCNTHSLRQKAAKVVVASDPAMQETIYDSGMQAALDSCGTNLPISLAPMTRYYWTVTVEGDGGDSATSEVNWFETAKMDMPWKAKWITPPWSQSGDDCDHPYIRKQFALDDKKIATARAYITGMGIYELHINGRRLGDEYLTPYCNTYDAWVQYQTFDITEALINGENAVGVMLANGWAKGRFGTFKENVPYTSQLSLICEIHVTYHDGSTDIFGTDTDWLCKQSPILFDNIYDGIVYDANQEIPGWSEAGLDETGWMAMRTFLPDELGKLTARLSLPVKIMEEIKPISVIKTPLGETVLDMGQNMVGWVRMRVDAPKGTKITLSHGEILQNGNFFRDNLRSAKAEYIYISDGSAKVVEPRFTFYGFRYVKIEGLPPSSVDINNFTGCVLYSDLETIGDITTSDERVNRLFKNALWGQKGNFLDVPTDCPQRDERMGWTGDTQIFAGTAMFNMRAYAFYVKFMYDLYEEQKLCGGLVPSIVPMFLKDRPLNCGFKGGGGCAWSDCATVVPWQVYQHTGDKTILKKQYQSMKDWVNWVTKKCESDGTGYLWTEGFQYGDWLALDGPDKKSAFGGTDTGYLASAYYKLSAQLVSKAAEILGYTEDAMQYAALSESIKSAIQKAYFNPDGSCIISTQTAHVVALQFELADESMRARILSELITLLEKNDMKLTTGFIGTPYLCRSLSDNGASEKAYELFFNEDYPGWLYPVKMGATTIWERWNSVLPDGLLSDTGMNSLNHYAYGSIAEWMYRNMCGINFSAPGFKEILFKPEPNPQLAFAKAEVKTAMGLVKCGWTYNGGNMFTIESEVPFNTTATILLANVDEITGLCDTVNENGAVRCNLKPGRYKFTITQGAN